MSVGPTRAADIQDPNSNAIATQYFNSNLSREMCSNCWLCQDSRINLLEVLNRPTTDVDFWTAFLSGTDGWLQPLKLYATYSGVKQLSGKPKTTWNRSALVEVLWCYKSQPLALCSELLWFIQLFSSEHLPKCRETALWSTARFNGIITKQSFFQISTFR